MLTNILIWLLEKLLNGKLSPEKKNRLVVHILRLENALPIRASMVSSDEGLLINGEPLDFDSAVMLRDQATRVLSNKAFQLCADNVRYIAVSQGLATGLPPEDLLFYRASLWFADEMKNQLTILSGTSTVRE